MFHYKGRGLSASLASRLSTGNRGIQKLKDGGRTNFFTRNSALQGRLGLPARRKESVYNRLSLGTNISLFRSPQIRSKTFLKSIQALEDNHNTAVVHHPRQSIKTKSYTAESLPVRITNGAVVKGLRSDQLLLQKYQQQKNRGHDSKKERLPMQRTKSFSKTTNTDLPKRSSRVTLDFNSGLTVSFTNDAVKRNRPVRRRTPSPQFEAMSSSSEEDYPVKKRRRSSSRVEHKDESFKPPLLRIGVERPPPPKPHRQILDPQVQKEIAALQGHLDSPHSGPGPGVKNFRMIPTLTRYSLSERFTIERTMSE